MDLTAKVIKPLRLDQIETALVMRLGDIIAVEFASAVDPVYGGRIILAETIHK